MVLILFQCSQHSQCNMGLWKWIVTWAHDLRSRSQIGMVGDYGSHSLIRWCGSGCQTSCSGGPSPCFSLSALPCSTSAHDSGVHQSPKRDMKMCSECLGKCLTLFSEFKKPLSHHKPGTFIPIGGRRADSAGRNLVLAKVAIAGLS